MLVLDLTRLLPGPYCARILADFGFEVIKVERPGEGDWARGVPPFKDGVSTLFQALNHGKQSLTLDLKFPAGREIFLEIATRADVLLESFRPGVMENLDLDYESLAHINPRLVYCSLTGYGDRGLYRNRPGHDLNYIGLSGLLDLTGNLEGPPAIPGGQIADVGGALWAVVGIQQALLTREHTGRGQRVDSSLLGAAISMLPIAAARETGGDPMERGASDLTGGWVCYQVYATKDGKYMTLGALEPKFWGDFCQVVGREDLFSQQFAPAIPGEPVYEQLCTLFRSRTQADWLNAFKDVETCCEPVYSLTEALKSEPVQTLGILVDNTLRPPVRLSEHEYKPPARAPALGEQTAEILGELGYTADQIRAMKALGVV
jgi:crotonobetainyl-CoA:carnitine CoA-transferase CaiB-like acyl-CoA transferase